MYVDKNKFFRDISDRANHVDVDSVRTIYYAMIKTILTNVEQEGVAYLPNFGKFTLAELAGRFAPNLHGSGKQYWPKRKIVKFTANDLLKKYFKNKS